MKKKLKLPAATLADFEDAGGPFYIWSVKWQEGEDMVFWGPQCAGYFTSIEDAGIYSAQKAYDITKGATNPTGEGLLITSRLQYLRHKADILSQRDNGIVVAIPASTLKDIITIRRVAKI